MSEIPAPDYALRLEALRSKLELLDFDALIVPHDDEYLSYELSPECERIRYLSGFTGSAGYVMVQLSPDEKALEQGVELISPSTGTTGHNQGRKAHKGAAIFVDGRYDVQVKEEVNSELFDIFNFIATEPASWLCSLLPRGSRVGIDLSCISYEEFLKLKQALEEYEITLADTGENLVDAIWEDRPPRTFSQVEIYPDDYNGCPTPQKRRNLAHELRERELDAVVICDCESICWLLNIRGADRRYLPVINGRMVAYSNEALEWFVDERHLSDSLLQDLESHVGHIDIFPEERFGDVLERLCTSTASVFADPKYCSAKWLHALYEGGARVVEGVGLLQLPKACKNHMELAGEFKAHIKDGVAMCRFLCWLDELVFPAAGADSESVKRRAEDFDERALAERAESFRKVEADYRGPSFETISALGENAAMCHYSCYEVDRPRTLGADCLYLIDSGAHFLDGTTDITRTVLCGSGLTDEIKKIYTLVLKAHISLCTLIFPPGTSGVQIDAIARRPLWDHGFDYEHGTGHGVGHVLSVHEGPQAISRRSSPLPLQEGMVVSDEPGYYREGQFGIRLENLLVVQRCTQPGLQHMLCFSPLTLVPFDHRLIVKEMLTTRERDWLNNYHQNVHNVIENAAATLTETEVAWLRQATAAL
ncbi:MAG: aminopeptidase P family protein [Succinivibrio sp.]|nr:aminopeptidase P family protein [Succinivibrio sp.]